MKKEKISIIVPVYNVEAYIRTCLRSLVSQDYANYDILVVNDGSPANEQLIIEEFMACYPDKIKYIQKENGGYGSVLQLAFAQSDADLVLICDPDDYLAKDALSTLMALRQKTKAELVVSAKNLIFSDNQEEKYDPSYNLEYGKPPEEVAVKSDEEAFGSFYFLEPSPHGKLYERALVAKIVFPQKVSYTDNLLYFYALARVKSVAYSAKATAYYLIDRQGNTRGDVKPRVIDAWNTVFTSILQQAPASSPWLWYRLYEGFFSVYYKIDNLQATSAEKKEKYEMLLPLLLTYRCQKEAIIPLLKKYSHEGEKMLRLKIALLQDNSERTYRKMYTRRLYGSYKAKLKKWIQQNAFLEKLYRFYHFHAKYFYTRHDRRLYVAEGIRYEKWGDKVSFFGYYDKPAFAYGKRLYHQVPTNSLSLHQEVAIMVDDQQVSCTTTWNWQQGSMATWLDEDHIIHNFFDGQAYRAKEICLSTRQERIYRQPIYSVAKKGHFALSLNFSRLAKLRPDYGYFNLPYQQLPPDTEDGIYYGKLDNDQWELFLSLQQIKEFSPQTSMRNAVHKVNHIDISPDEKQAIFLHRWFVGKTKYTRLLHVDLANKQMKVLADRGMVSHMAWVNNHTVFGFLARQDGKDGYAYIDTQSQIETAWNDPLLVDDGHPSVYNERYIVTDTYPDYRCQSKLLLLDHKKKKVSLIAEFYSGKPFQGEYRCDLHPRFDAEGRSLTLDSVCEKNQRHVYHLFLDKYMEEETS